MSMNDNWGRKDIMFTLENSINEIFADVLPLKALLLKDGSMICLRF